MADPIVKQEVENIAATVARECRKPFELSPQENAVPDGWKVVDTEHLQPVPRRKIATVTMGGSESFIEYVKRHGKKGYTTIWCDANYKAGNVAYTGIINDHGGGDEAQDWRDHLAEFTPIKSVEWERWVTKNRSNFNQLEFATFIEDNIADIATAKGFPSGTDMLQMATSLEIAQDSSIKSAVRLQSGGVRMEYVDDANAETAKSMEVFRQFALGIPVFYAGAAYMLEARLKYKLSAGKLTFWYELIRQDKVVEDAAKTLTATIQEQTGFPLFHGKPFA